MNKRPSSNKHTVSVKGIYIKGKAKANGDFVGRDKIVGMSSKDVVKVIEALNKNLSPKYQEAKHLSQALRKFKKYHKALYEWKELHNELNEILIQFYPFYVHIQSLKATPRKAMFNHLSPLWHPTSKRIDNLIFFSRDIKIIGKPFQETNGILLGERWVIDFYNLDYQMKSILDEVNYLGNPLIGRPGWWDKLQELTGKINGAIIEHLTEGDKKLRETAMKLYDLSEIVFLK